MEKDLVERNRLVVFALTFMHLGKSYERLKIVDLQLARLISNFHWHF